MEYTSFVEGDSKEITADYDPELLDNIMEFCTIHLRDVFIRVLLKTDLGEELGKPSHSVERDRRAMNSTVGSLLLLTQ